MNSLSDNFIEFKNISVIKDGKVVLKKISVVIPKGENIAILGPNGSGKSSFIQLITRELYPAMNDEGYTYLINGRDNWNIFDLKSLFGIVSGDLQSLFSREINGRDVILSGFFSSIGLFNHVIEPFMEKKTEEIAQFLEIQHLMERSMTHMSSGEARRCLIGRALVHDPEVLILDEPTNNLDLHALHVFRNSMRKIAQSGKMILMVTHNLSDIIPEISRIVMIKNGRILKTGEKSELLTDTQVRDLFNVKISVHIKDGYYYAF